MANQITYGDPSRQAILRGGNSLANAVKVTLGPRGRNVIIGQSYGSALQNAASVAGLLLTTEAVISKIPAEQANAPAHDHM